MSSSLLKRKLEEDIALSDSDNDASTELDDNTSVDSAKNRGKKDENNDEKDKKKEEEVLLQVTKRPRMAKPFTEELLTSWDGMKRIYEEFPMKCRFNARGSEAAYLWRLLGLYKEWAFQLHPGLAFNDILRKTETLGARGKVRVELSRMRDIERDRFIDEHYPEVKEQKERRRQLAIEREEMERLRVEREYNAQVEEEKLQTEIMLAQQIAAASTLTAQQFFPSSSSSNYIPHNPYANFAATEPPVIIPTVNNFDAEDLPEDLPDDLIALLDGRATKPADEVAV